MKRLILLFLVLTSVITLSQNSKITYKAVLHNPKNSSKPKVFQHIKYANMMKFNLIFNDSISSFQREPNVFLEFQDRDKKLTVGITEVLLGYTSIGYQDSNNNSSKLHRTVDAHYYHVDYSKNMKDWTITDETKEILGYLCRKATKEEFDNRTGKTRKRIAWFAPEIKYSYGPINYGGLPGLILEFHKGNLSSFYAEKIELGSVDKKPLTAPNIEKTGYKKFKKKQREAIANVGN